jgi:hypothetical protein
MGWSRSQVGQYARLQDIDKQAWQMIVTTFDDDRHKPGDEAVTDDVTPVTSPFTEFLLREIISLTADQQRKLVQKLIKDRDKATFKSQAEYYRAENDMESPAPRARTDASTSRDFISTAPLAAPVSDHPTANLVASPPAPRRRLLPCPLPPVPPLTHRGS